MFGRKKEQINLNLMVGLTLIVGILVIMMVPELFTDKSPYTIQRVKFSTSETGALEVASSPFPPGEDYWLGSDELGRDIYSFILYGTRLTISFGLLISLSNMLVALIMSIIGGFGHKGVKTVIEQFNIVFSAIPAVLINVIILSLAFFVGLDKKHSVIAFIVVLTFTGWARLGTVLVERVENILRQPFILGEVTIGKKRAKIAIENVFPHLIPEVLVLYFMEVARSLTMIMQLGIFGVFIGNLRIIKNSDWGNLVYFDLSFEPEWASLIATSRAYINVAPWMVLAPAIAFFISVLGFNLFGEGLRLQLQKKESMLIPNVRRFLSFNREYYIQGIKQIGLKKGILIGIAVVIVFVVGTISQRNTPFIMDPVYETEAESILFGSQESYSVAENIRYKMEELGIEPLEDQEFIIPYNLGENYLIKECDLEISKDGKPLELVRGIDYQAYQALDGEFSGPLYDTSYMDLYTLSDYEVFNQKIVLIDGSYYNQMFITNLMNKIWDNSQVKGFLILSETIQEMKLITMTTSDYPVLTISQDLKEQLYPSDDINVQLSFELQTNGETGYNVAGIYKGDSDVADEAVVIGMSYNYFEKSGTELLGFAYEIMEQLCGESNRRSLIFMFYDGTLDETSHGIYWMIDDLNYSSQKIKAYIDLSKVSNNQYSQLWMSTSQAPVTRPLVWSIGHHMTQLLEEKGMEYIEADTINIDGSYLINGDYSLNTMFWDRGLATIHIGTVPSENNTYQLEDLGELLIEVIKLNNF